MMQRYIALLCLFAAFALQAHSWAHDSDTSAHESGHCLVCQFAEQDDLGLANAPFFAVFQLNATLHAPLNQSSPTPHAASPYQARAPPFFS